MCSGFRKRSCGNKKLERDDDSTKSHPALAQPRAVQFSAIRRVQRFDEPEAHDLARTGSWNFRHDVDLLRNLVGRQTGAAVSQQRVDIQFTALRRPRTGEAPRPAWRARMPTTAQSITCGCRTATSSISAGAIFCPPRMISSLIRPVIVRYPLASDLREVAGMIPALAQRRCGFGRFVVIAVHEVRAADNQLALAAKSERPPA